MSDTSKSKSSKPDRAKPRATPVVVNPAISDGRPTLGRTMLRSIKRKLLVFAVLIAVMAVWGAWQYSRRQAVQSETLGDYRINGAAVTVLVVEPDVTLDISAGLRRDYTVQIARALAKRFGQLGYQTHELAARSDEERFGQTTRVSDHAAAAQHQTQTTQAIRDAKAPVLRVSLQDLKFDGHTVSEQNYRVELLDPQTLQPSWRATLTWREGRYQSIALLWNLRKNQLPPPLWDNLADLAIAQLRKDNVLPASNIQ